LNAPSDNWAESGKKNGLAARKLPDFAKKIQQSIEIQSFMPNLPRQSAMPWGVGTQFWFRRTNFNK
jgi:hypothetical protein